MHLSFSSDSRAVRFLVNNRANVGCVDPITGYTPLHNAALNGLTEIVRILVSKGADLDCKVNGGGLLFISPGFVVNLRLPSC
jgi:ankyrin repeat protein